MVRDIIRATCEQPGENRCGLAQNGRVPSQELPQPMSLFVSKLTARLGMIAGSALLGYLSLAALQLKVVWGGWAQWDVPLWDGATYFIYGRQVAASLIFPPLAWSPAFAGYYALFQWLLGGWGPLAVYFAHRVVTLLLVVWLLYGLLRALLPAFIAWLLTASYISFQVGLNNYFVVHLFVLIPLLIAYRASLSPSALGRNFVLIGLLTAAFVRSEFFLSVALVLVGMIAAALRRRREPWNAGIQLRRYAPALIWAVVLAVMIVRAGPSHVALDRSWGAFEQHYAWGYQERHPEWNVNFWFKYAEAVQRSFGSAQSIVQAAIDNPIEMATHFLWNLHVLPSVLPELLSPLPGMAWGLILPGLGAIGLPVALIRYWDARRRRPRLLGLKEGRVGRLVTVMAVTWLPLVISIMVIRPRTIYLMPLWPPLLLIAGVGLMSLLPKWATPKELVALLLPLCLIGLVIFPSPFKASVEHAVLETSQRLKDLPIDGDFSLLGPSARGFCVYSLPDRCRGVELVQVPQTVADFPDYLARENIQVIIVNDQVLNNLPAAGRAFIAQLLAQPAEVGWQAISQAGPFQIYLRPSTGGISP